jgi:uncharacterized membrane protein YhiD involved in acid resistance
MQLQQSLTEMFGNPTTLSSLPAFVLSLCLAAVLGLVLGHAYARFGQSLSNRKAFARNFLLLTVTTTLIISIVKTSLALSLGLVGALSIVRFRAAIKEPEELAFLFLAIAIGLGLGAGQVLATLVALAVILGLVAIRGLFQQAPPQPNLYVTVSSPAAGKLSAGQILEALNASGARASLRRLDDTPDQLEASFLVDFREVAKLEQFTGRLRELCQGVKVSCLEDRGLVA